MPASEGKVAIGGRTVAGPAHEVAMVFQTFALFPWLTVLENVEIGLEALSASTPPNATSARWPPST